MLFNNISEYFDSFARLTENLKLYNFMKPPNKNCQKTKEKSINILSNGPYTIKNLLLIKDILKTLPSNGINNYIKI